MKSEEALYHFFLFKKSFIQIDRRFTSNKPKFKIATIEYDESLNKLITYMLIGYNNKMLTTMTKATNMTKLKCSKYLCLWISNVEDTCIELKLIYRSKPSRFRNEKTKQRRTKTPKKPNVTLRRRYKCVVGTLSLFKGLTPKYLSLDHGVLPVKSTL